MFRLDRFIPAYPDSLEQEMGLGLSSDDVSPFKIAYLPTSPGKKAIHVNLHKIVWIWEIHIH